MLTEPGRETMSDPQDRSGGQWTIYWEREYSTAIPPERLKLDFHPHRPLMTNMPLQDQRELAASGYKVVPDDCGPVRMVGQYEPFRRNRGGVFPFPINGPLPTAPILGITHCFPSWLGQHGTQRPDTPRGFTAPGAWPRLTNHVTSATRRPSSRASANSCSLIPGLSPSVVAEAPSAPPPLTTII